MARSTAPGVPLRSLRGGAPRFCGLLVAAALLAGCPDKKQPTGAAPDAGAAAPSIGLRVPLPRGWSARAESGDVLAIGPVGRDVMRIRRSRQDTLPKLDSLQSQLRAQLDGVQAETVAERVEPDLVLWRIRMTSPDQQVSWPAVMGARKVQEAVYFCATEPGATDGEVKDAAEACANLGR